MNSATCTVAMIVVTSLVSMIGFYDHAFREKHLFSVREILAGKQYYRLITSAFLHADWNHLLMNMISLYLFGQAIELVFGVGQFLLLYFTAIIGGGLLSLWLHRHQEYRAYGASGGVCGIIFSHILLFPGGSISMILFPIGIPSWLYAILFLVGSFFALKMQADNIGHDAHLGGAMVGLLTVAALHPATVKEHPILFLTVSAISFGLFIYFLLNPLFLPLTSFDLHWPQRRKPSGDLPTHKRENLAIDAILEKISREGVQSLSPEESELLKSVSEKYQRRADSKKPESDLIL